MVLLGLENTQSTLFADFLELVRVTTSAMPSGELPLGEPAQFDTKEQGPRCKIGKGAGSRQMIILEQGAPEMTKRSMEQG